MSIAGTTALPAASDQYSFPTTNNNTAISSHLHRQPFLLIIHYIYTFCQIFHQYLARLGPTYLSSRASRASHFISWWDHDEYSAIHGERERERERERNMHTRRLHLVSICSYAARNCMLMVHLWRWVSIRLHGEVSREVGVLVLVQPLGNPLDLYILLIFINFNGPSTLSLSLSLSPTHAPLLGRYRSSENGWTWLVCFLPLISDLVAGSSHICVWFRKQKT